MYRGCRDKMVSNNDLECIPYNIIRYTTVKVEIKIVLDLWCYLQLNGLILQKWPVECPIQFFLICRPLQKKKKKNRKTPPPRVVRNKVRSHISSWKWMKQSFSSQKVVNLSVRWMYQWEVRKLSFWGKDLQISIILRVNMHYLFLVSYDIVKYPWKFCWVLDSL